MCGYPVENLQVEGVSSFQHALVFQDLQRHVGHVGVGHRDAVLPQTPVCRVQRGQAEQQNTQTEGNKRSVIYV